jgi:hypothetical protein
MKVVERMMKENSDASKEDFVAVLGGNAAKLFKRANLADKVAAAAEAFEIA